MKTPGGKISERWQPLILEIPLCTDQREP